MSTDLLATRIFSELKDCGLPDYFCQPHTIFIRDKNVPVDPITLCFHAIYSYMQNVYNDDNNSDAFYVIKYNLVSIGILILEGQTAIIFPSKIYDHYVMFDIYHLYIERSTLLIN